MYLHLGQGTVTREKDLIGIFELDNTTSSRVTRVFLERAERAGEVESAGEDLPKSFVLCADGVGRQRIVLSQLSTATLRLKAEKDLLE